MSERRLLLLCYFYPPLAGGGVHRVLSFTRHLPAHGWRCTVICAGEHDYWVRDESLTTTVPPETEVIRVPGGSLLAGWLRWRRSGRATMPGDSASWMRRLSDWCLMPDSYIGWAERARATAARRLARGDVDVMLSSSPPESVHLAAMPLARRFRVPWVADFRDPWIGLYRRQPPSVWHRDRQHALERTVMERADLVLSASRTQMDLVQRGSGARPRRSVVIPNGFEPVRGPEPTADGTFRIVFTGSLALLPETDVFLEAIDELLRRHTEARRRVRVKFAGPFNPGYRDRAVALGLTGIVEFLGQRPNAEIRELQRAADVLTFWLPRRTSAAIPGKLYEYLDAGRPIVAVLQPDDEALELVRRGGGAVVSPGDRRVLADELERHYVAWKANGRAPSRRPEWLDDFSRERSAERLAAELDRVRETKP